MLKMLAVLSLALLILHVETHSQTYKAQEAAQSNKPTLPTAPPVVPKQNNGPALQAKSDGHVDANVRVISAPAKDRYDRAAFWISVVLAIAGVAGIGVAIATLLRIHRQAVEMRLQRVLMQRTLNTMRRHGDLMEKQLEEVRLQREQTGEEMRRQSYQMGEQAHAARKSAESAKRSAEAALLNTQAFINKERSRLFIRHEITEGFEAKFWVTNLGQSPAILVYSFVGSEFTQKGQSLRLPPNYTGGDPEWVFQRDDWLAPYGNKRVGESDNSFISMDSNPELYQSVMSGNDIVWYYGIVKYRDTVTEAVEEVRFCYRCHPFESGKHWLSEDGPPEYRHRPDRKSQNPN